MNGWTQVRQYDVWSLEDHYAFVEVWMHRNGWYSVQANDGTMWVLQAYKTRSEHWAYREAQRLIEEYAERAEDECLYCGLGDQEDREMCSDPRYNPYDASHGVRWYCEDMIEGRKLEPYEL